MLVVYQGHHGDAGAHRADAIFPGAAYTEKDATYVNTEGRVQRAEKASFPLGQAKEDWAIVRALSEALGNALPYDTTVEVRQRMIEINSVFSRVDEITENEWGVFGEDGQTKDKEFGAAIPNYYMTDAISRASNTMAECMATVDASDKTMALFDD